MHHRKPYEHGLISSVLQDGHDQYELAATSEQGGDKKKEKKKKKEKDMDELKKEVDMVSVGQTVASFASQ